MRPRSDTIRRLRNEQTHNRRIASFAESAWNWNSPSGRRRAARRAGFYVEALNDPDGIRALEIGCGSGVFLERALTSRASIVALDLSPEFIASARRKLSGDPGALFCCGNAECLPFPAESFDVVYGSSVLHHLDPRAALAELRRVLRPGGRLIFAEPNLLNPQIAFAFLLPFRRFLNVSPDEKAFTRFGIRKILERLGFVDVSSEPYDFLHPLVPAALLNVVEKLSRRLERVPLVREIAGSQIIRARKP